MESAGLTTLSAVVEVLVLAALVAVAVLATCVVVIVGRIFTANDVVVAVVVFVS